MLLALSVYDTPLSAAENTTFQPDDPFLLIEAESIPASELEKMDFADANEMLLDWGDCEWGYSAEVLGNRNFGLFATLRVQNRESLPEPSAWLLMVCSCAWLAGAHWNRKIKSGTKGG